MRTFRWNTNCILVYKPPRLALELQSVSISLNMAISPSPTAAVVVMSERNYLEEFHQNILLTDNLLKMLNQGVVVRKETKGMFRTILELWPIIYCTSWCLIYLYMIFGERAGLELTIAQVWCLMSITQTSSKLINGNLAKDKVQSLLKWCRSVYTAKYKIQYRAIINGVFEKTNSYISWCIKINTVLIFSAVGFYVSLPMWQGNQLTPTPLTFGGQMYTSGSVYLTTYGAQMIHAFCVSLTLSGYDAIFILCTMIMTYRFKTMIELLKLLQDCTTKDGPSQREIIVDIYKMHLELLE